MLNGYWFAFDFDVANNGDEPPWPLVSVLESISAYTTIIGPRGLGWLEINMTGEAQFTNYTEKMCITC